MTENATRGCGRPSTGKTPGHTVRIGCEWEEAQEVANARGETMTEVIRRALAAYVRRHHREAKLDHSGRTKSEVTTPTVDEVGLA